MPQLNNEDFEKRREKWKQLVESEEINAPKINDTHMKGVVYQVLENTERELNEATQTGDIALKHISSERLAEGNASTPVTSNATLNSLSPMVKR